MSLRSPHRATTALPGCLLLLWSAALCASDPQAPAPRAADPTSAELPSFKPGLWEYRRTLTSAQSVNPQVSSIKKCANPGVDMREKKEALKKKGCQFEPVKREDNRYTSSWSCTTAGGVLKFHSVLIVKDATGYEDQSEMRGGQHFTQQRIEATRLGECPPGGVGK